MLVGNEITQQEYIQLLVTLNVAYLFLNTGEKKIKTRDNNKTCNIIQVKTWL